MGPFDSRPLEWEGFRNAYGVLDIWLDYYEYGENENLEGFTHKQLIGVSAKVSTNVGSGLISCA